MTGALDPALVLSAARQWLGTPYLHQARCRGAGCDCLGLILGIWADLGGTAPQIPPYSQDWSEAGHTEHLWRAAQDLLIARPVAAAVPGHVILFRMRAGCVAKHLGILSGTAAEPSFIHSMSGRGVVQSRLTAPWARRLVAAFALPQIGG